MKDAKQGQYDPVRENTETPLGRCLVDSDMAATSGGHRTRRKAFGLSFGIGKPPYSGVTHRSASSHQRCAAARPQAPNSAHDRQFGRVEDRYHKPKLGVAAWCSRRVTSHLAFGIAVARSRCEFQRKRGTRR